MKCKKSLFAVLSISMILFLYGCSEKPNKATTSQQPVQSTVQAVSSEEDSEQSGVEDDVDVDVDLTQLSSIMCYSEVYTMITYPEQYIGKTVRMKGTMAHYSSGAESGQNYFAVLIADALACCQQGIEFVLEGGSRDVKDYPLMNTEVTVVGEFATYEENGMTYCNLIHARVEE